MRAKPPHRRGSSCNNAPTRFLHDCRRTAARNLIRASVAERVAMLLTGHKSRAIFDRYNIINEQELIDAGDQLIAYLEQHAQATPRGGRPHPARTAAPRRPSASCDAPPRKRARGGPSGETGLDTIVRDHAVAQQERVRERLRDLREALACAVAARKRPMNAH